jgi:hypothetical protein
MSATMSAPMGGSTGPYVDTGCGPCRSLSIRQGPPAGCRRFGTVPSEEFMSLYWCGYCVQRFVMCFFCGRPTRVPRGGDIDNAAEARGRQRRVDGSWQSDCTACVQKYRSYQALYVEQAVAKSTMCGEVLSEEQRNEVCAQAHRDYCDNVIHPNVERILRNLDSAQVNAMRGEPTGFVLLQRSGVSPHEHSAAPEMGGICGVCEKILDVEVCSVNRVTDCMLCEACDQVFRESQASCDQVLRES